MQFDKRGCGVGKKNKKNKKKQGRTFFGAGLIKRKKYFLKDISDSDSDTNAHQTLCLHCAVVLYLTCFLKCQKYILSIHFKTN